MHIACVKCKKPHKLFSTQIWGAQLKQSSDPFERRQRLYSCRVPLESRSFYTPVIIQPPPPPSMWLFMDCALQNVAVPLGRPFGKRLKCVWWYLLKWMWYPSHKNQTFKHWYPLCVTVFKLVLRERNSCHNFDFAFTIHVLYWKQKRYKSKLR